VIVNAYVLKMCFHILPHLYTWRSKISTCGMCFHKNLGMRMCILMKIPTWQGNAIVFPAWKRVCVRTCFFCVSSRLKSVAVFLAQAHPNRRFCQKLFTFRDQKLRKRLETTCSGKNRTSQNHMTIARKKHQNLKPIKIQNITERTKPIAKLNITST
jgi:hypothetical protein